MKQFFSQENKGDTYETVPEKKPGFFSKFKESFKTAYEERIEAGTQRATGTGAGASLLANEMAHPAESTNGAKKGASSKQ